jgi:hypothetical protein
MPHAPSNRSAFMRLLIEHNPFYLLSAACMLAGCLALTNSLSWNPIATKRLLTLIVTLQVYEAALIGLAIYLVTSRGLVRDGRILLILEAVFLVDAAFLNAEIATLNFKVGLMVNGILFVLAAMKIWLVTRSLYPNYSFDKLAFIWMQLAVLFAIPCTLRGIDKDGVSSLAMYFAWWMAALLPAMYELMAGQPHAVGEPWSRGVAPMRAYLALPYISLLVHVGILHYVYDVAFYGAMAGPVLLGLTLILNRVQPSTVIPRKDLLALRILLPVAAVFVSMNNPQPLRFSLGTNALLQFTPLSLASGAAYLIYVYCFFLPHALMLIGVAAVCMVVAVFGPAPRTLWRGWVRVWDWTVPRTLFQWGVIGLAASFAFLGLGAWVSLKKTPATSVTDEQL